MTKLSYDGFVLVTSTLNILRFKDIVPEITLPSIVQNTTRRTPESRMAERLRS